MISLQNLLNQSSHRHLELIARAHKIAFTRRESKSLGLAKLSEALHDGAYKKAFQNLNPEHIEALQALVAGGDYLPLPLFTAHFGEIRRYRPWRKYTHFRDSENPRHPWRYPISAAERLYHLGFIHVYDGEMVQIVREVKDMLPALVSPSPVGTSNGMYEGIGFPLQRGGTEGGIIGVRADVLHDLAALLATLIKTDAEAIHGRWFSLATMRQLNEHFIIKEDLSHVRSELQSGRLRWLHYLAQVSGLLSIQNGLFKPTVEAWRWLSAPQDVQWDSLMQAVEVDLEARDRLWDIFRFPEISRFTWQVLRHSLDDLAPENAYCVKDFLQSLKPYLLPESRYRLALMLRDIFQWSGTILLRHGRFYVHRQTTASPKQSRLQMQKGRIILPLLDRRPSPELTRLLSFVQIEGEFAILDPEAVAASVRQGMDTTAIIATLSHFAVVPDDIQIQISQWVTAAEKLTLQTMIVLHSPDAEIIKKIRSDWRLAGHFSKRLSPNHLAVVAEDAHKLLSRLQRRDYEVNSYLPVQKSRRITEELNPDMAEYLLLAVRSYQKLQSRLGASVPVPKALTHWLTAQVENPAAIEEIANTLVQAVQKQIPQQYPIADKSQQDEATIRRLIYLAYHRKTLITIDYYSPHLDETSTRTIAVQEIYDSNDLTYIEAHCQLVNELRTFRLDRILRVHEPVLQTIAV